MHPQVKTQVKTITLTAELNRQKEIREISPKQREISIKLPTVANTEDEMLNPLKHRTRPEIKNVSRDNSRTSNFIHFNAELSCRTRIGEQYENLSTCQSRPLWEGDQFKLTFESDQPVYLYVLLSNPKGQLQTLFPRGKVNNLLLAGQKFALPHRTWFTLDDVGPVKEKITVIYSRKPLQSFEELRDLNKPPNSGLNLQKLAMHSTRGVILDDGDTPRLVVVSSLENQTEFTGKYDINRIEFILHHQGPRPQ